MMRGDWWRMVDESGLKGSGVVKREWGGEKGVRVAS